MVLIKQLLNSSQHNNLFNNTSKIAQLFWMLTINSCLEVPTCCLKTQLMSKKNDECNTSNNRNYKKHVKFYFSTTMVSSIKYKNLISTQFKEVLIAKF